MNPETAILRGLHIQANCMAEIYIIIAVSLLFVPFTGSSVYRRSIMRYCGKNFSPKKAAAFKVQLMYHSIIFVLCVCIFVGHTYVSMYFNSCIFMSALWPTLF